MIKPGDRHGLDSLAARDQIVAPDFFGDGGDLHCLGRISSAVIAEIGKCTGLVHFFGSSAHALSALGHLREEIAFARD